MLIKYTVVILIDNKSNGRIGKQTAIHINRFIICAFCVSDVAVVSGVLLDFAVYDAVLTAFDFNFNLRDVFSLNQIS